MSADTLETSTTEPTTGHSYRQILRSTAIIGISYIVVTVISVVRMKSLALLLGPTGIGLIGLYTLVIDLAVAVAAMGVPSSGVRQIAEATSSGSAHQVGGTAATLRWLSLGLGIAGGAVLAAFCVPVSVLTFGSDQQALAVAALGGVVLLRLLYGAEATLIQGVRRTRDIAVTGILNALTGTAFMVALVYFLGPAGIVPALLAGAVAGLVVIWIYARKIGIEKVSAIPAVRENAGPLLRLGFVFMISGLLTTGAAYVIRIIVMHGNGVEAAGLYQSAWAVAALYVGFILQAMGMDFYPRLTENAGDNVACNRLVNEQARVSMLLAGPGVIATITLAPLVLTVFYSGAFIDAVPTLRWLCLGMMLRTVAWPVGFIILAKGAQRAFFWTEVGATAIHVGLAALLVPWFGLEGAGIAFCGLYVGHVAMVYLVARSISGFRWSKGNIKLGLVYLIAAGATFAGFSILPFAAASVLGLLLTAACGMFSLRDVLSFLPTEAAPRFLRPLLSRLASKPESA